MRVTEAVGLSLAHYLQIRSTITEKEDTGYEGKSWRPALGMLREQDGFPLFLPDPGKTGLHIFPEHRVFC